MHEQRIRRKVEYADTDMSGIVHFSRFLVFLENAEHAFLQAVGPGVQWRDAEGRELGWPRVAVSCEYLSPARFGDELAKGKMTCACCVLNDPSGIKAIPIPDEIAARIEVAPHQRED
jgi:acyl-CoA thioesterase FadM